MVKWVSLDSSWTLQDVQAGLNVIIAFLCAGSIFVLVRYCWLLAARRVAHARDVPAYSLLSLNTVGETIDVIWLLRHDLFTQRYKGLLLQCIFVILVTVATLLSGFIARFSTRYGTTIRTESLNGTIAERSTGTLLYAEVDTNLTFTALQQANFPQNKLLEYVPNDGVKWNYVADQWSNSSWTMDCTYNRSTEIPNPVATGDCTDLRSEFPEVDDNYWDWTANDSYSWNWDNAGWRRPGSDVWNDWIIFTHGVRYLSYDDDLSTQSKMEMRTVTIYLKDAPYNSTLDDTNCNFAPGPIGSAFYTSCSCMLTRNTTGRSKDDLYYGAYPEGSSMDAEVSAYLAHYGNRFRKEASRAQNITVIEGDELAMFYQAFQITKDTITSAYVDRDVDAYVRVPQVSFVTLVVCSIAAFIVLTGLVNYWLFLWRHWRHLERTPQSKLDWMLQTLKRENEDDVDKRRRLSKAMASGAEPSEGVPLNRIVAGDRKSVLSTKSSTFLATTPEPQQGDDSFDGPILGSNFTSAPASTWFPQQQYTPVGQHVRQQSFGRSQSNYDYNPVQPLDHSPYMWQGTHHVDTTYDPGRPR